MPSTTILDIPHQEQEQMRTALRRSRYGSLWAFHSLRLGAAGRHPTEIAACLFCSRSSGSRTVRLYRAGSLGLTVDTNGALGAPVRTTVRLPWMRRSLGTLLKTPPRASGWCRTPWSGVTLAAPLQGKHGRDVSAWTVRRWRQAMGWVWKRAKRRAKDADPARMDR